MLKLTFTFYEAGDTPFGNLWLTAGVPVIEEVDTLPADAAPVVASVTDKQQTRRSRQARVAFFEAGTAPLVESRRHELLEQAQDQLRNLVPRPRIQLLPQES